jgi:hypothetical protein
LGIPEYKLCKNKNTTQNNQKKKKKTKTKQKNKTKGYHCMRQQQHNAISDAEKKEEEKKKKKTFGQLDIVKIRMREGFDSRDALDRIHLLKRKTQINKSIARCKMLHFKQLSSHKEPNTQHKQIKKQTLQYKQIIQTNQQAKQNKQPITDKTISLYLPTFSPANRVLAVQASSKPRACSSPCV